MVIRLASVLVLASAAGLPAQQQGTPRCDAPEFRQFDFWIGDWNVSLPNGQLAGTNLVTLEEDGCLIREHWKGSGGSSGQSFNFYDRVRRQWRQVWIDNGGSALDFAGTFRDGRMAYSGTSTDASGRSVQHRLTFFRNDDGSVRQLWESSTDGGGSWTVAFDGLYRRKGA
jgi:hypothetical protein